MTFDMNNACPKLEEAIKWKQNTYTAKTTNNIMTSWNKNKTQNKTKYKLQKNLCFVSL